MTSAPLVGAAAGDVPCLHRTTGVFGDARAPVRRCLLCGVAVGSASATPRPAGVPGWSRTERALAWFRAWLEARGRGDVDLRARAERALRALGVVVSSVARQAKP